MKKILTGAETVARLLEEAGVSHMFAYPGTSELALCDSILRSKSITLINGRGDKESAFMAAGGNVFGPLKSVAILHGARGSTNALGAIADARKNDVSTLFIVGMPSTSSIPFLPPHGEPNLIEGITHFATEGYTCLEVTKDSDTEDIKSKKINTFLRIVKESIERCFSLPYGPVILGLPQDICEKAWIPSDAVNRIIINKSGNNSTVSEEVLLKISSHIESAKKPVILLDDPFLKLHNAKEALFLFASEFGIPILQVRYTRGPMLFERIQQSECIYYAGQYNHELEEHKFLIENTDLLITLNDRNCYERVIGKLPQCKKVALTTNAKSTKKNGYLTSEDILVEGDVPSILNNLVRLSLKKNRKATNTDMVKDAFYSSLPQYQSSSQYSYLRKGMAEDIGEVFRTLKNPVLVDDSQMLGGMLALSYDQFPNHTRVIGDHGAFVGGGLSFSTGLALVNPHLQVFCTLGDQAFINAMQGLISAKQENINIIYLVCNNGKSVSLLKQMKSQDETAFHNGDDRFLHNPPVNYVNFVQALGIHTYVIDLIRAKRGDLKNCMLEALSKKGPKFIELMAPTEEEAWIGVWATKGNEK